MASPEVHEDFVSVMRWASRKIHRTSNSLVNAKLVFAFADQALYGAALAQFHAVHVALEEAFDRWGTDAVELQALVPLMPLLRRAAAFKADMQFYLGRPWQQPLTPGQQAYVAHVAALGKQDPGLLLAHYWTQYGALTTGGQILRRMVLKSFKPPPGSGVSVFDFKEMGGGRSVKKELADTVNAVAATLTEERRQQLVEEHVRVFELNNGVLRDYQVGASGVFKALRRLAPALLAAAATVLLLCYLAWVALARLRWVGGEAQAAAGGAPPLLPAGGGGADDAGASWVKEQRQAELR